MATAPLVLWLLTGLGGLSLTPAAAVSLVAGRVGQPVTLPCLYSSWSQSRNSMCWGKGPCPKSKCSQELLHTDGARVLSRSSAKYALLGDIERGQVSLTISHTEPEDGGEYCCRIEVPGWFNDVKRNIRLLLHRPLKPKVPTTTTSPTTTTTTTATTATTTITTITTATTAGLATALTPTEGPPTAATTAPGPAAWATSVLPTVGTVAPWARSTEPGTLPAESGTSLPPATNSSGGPEAFPEDSAMPTSKGSGGWAVPSASSSALQRGRADAWTPRPGDRKKNTGHGNGQSNQVTIALIIASSLGFVLFLALLSAFLLRGKFVKTNCLQKHKRLGPPGESKTVLDDLQHGGDDEEGLFTL